MNSGSAAKTVDLATIALGGSILRKLFELQHRFPLLRQPGARLAAAICFAIESLGDGGGTSHLAKGQNFHLKIASFAFYLQQIADTDFARRLGGLAIGFYAAEVAGVGGDRSRFEESGSPEPLVYSNAHRTSLFDPQTDSIANGRSSATSHRTPATEPPYRTLAGV